MILPQHDDWFCISQKTPVASTAQCVTYHGKVIGYIEVSTLLDELAELFVVDNTLVKVLVTIDEDAIFYDTRVKDDFNITCLGQDEYKLFTDTNGIQRYAYHVHCPRLSMEITLL